MHYITFSVMKSTNSMGLNFERYYLHIFPVFFFHINNQFGLVLNKTVLDTNMYLLSFLFFSSTNAQ